MTLYLVGQGVRQANGSSALPRGSSSGSTCASCRSAPASGCSTGPWSWGRSCWHRWSWSALSSAYGWRDGWASRRSTSPSWPRRRSRPSCWCSCESAQTRRFAMPPSTPRTVPVVDGDERAGEVGDRVGHLVGRHQATHRLAGASAPPPPPRGPAAAESSRPIQGVSAVPGRDGVHADAFADVVGCHRQGQRVDGALAGRVERRGCARRPAATTDDTLTMDAARELRSSGRAAAATRAMDDDVHVHDAVPLGAVVGGDVTGRADPGVVDEDVQAAVAGPQVARRPPRRRTRR